MGTGYDRVTRRWLFGKCDFNINCSGVVSGNKSVLTVRGEIMRGILSFILLLIGGLFIGVTVDDSIVGTSIVKGIGALCMIGFWRLFPHKKHDLY